jgi:hypothetical protein
LINNVPCNFGTFAPDAYLQVYSVAAMPNVNFSM